MRLGIVNGDDHSLISIKDKNVHTFFINNDLNHPFDFLVFNKKIVFHTNNLLACHSLNNNYVLINTDVYDSFAQFANSFLITYGMNNKACITASSVNDNNIQICIQRNLLALNHNIIEEQEFSIALPNADSFLYQIMYLSAANVLYYGDTNHLNLWF